MALVKSIPSGRVATFDAIARNAHCAPQHVITIFSSLSDDEREAFPWHRAVAKGGAIGRGPWRERQFACLVREGVAVSPAGIVQDMARVAVADLSEAGLQTHRQAAESPPAPPRLGRSRGMKDRPGP